MDMSAPRFKNVTLKISPSSIMAMQGILMNTRKSLMDFPQPFLNPLKINKNELAFVYSAAPNPDILAASAIVASIFGIKSEEKRITFMFIWTKSLKSMLFYLQQPMK